MTDHVGQPKMRRTRRAIEIDGDLLIACEGCGAGVRESWLEACPTCGRQVCVLCWPGSPRRHVPPSPAEGRCRFCVAVLNIAGVPATLLEPMGATEAAARQVVDDFVRTVAGAIDQAILRGDDTEEMADRVRQGLDPYDPLGLKQLSAARTPGLDTPDSVRSGEQGRQESTHGALQPTLTGGGTQETGADLPGLGVVRSAGRNAGMDSLPVEPAAATPTVVHDLSRAPGYACRHTMTWPEPVDRETADKYVLSQRFFGYHPAGYGGIMEPVPYDGEEPRTVWVWCHSHSSD